ncbi:hypothetical protein AW736_01815 [Termitidicoccus mucosus]|uniref:Uncharacterized protein n=2 Tax=Termitidicoccus mucosus TaxID=1184151 RepID=A0A178IP67_9BACT|nr:hypothetical protein AW736_01815 [Opitutaceae bacterium TSB47]
MAASQKARAAAAIRFRDAFSRLCWPCKWYAEDCKTPTFTGDILTEKNRRYINNYNGSDFMEDAIDEALDVLERFKDRQKKEEKSSPLAPMGPNGEFLPGPPVAHFCPGDIGLYQYKFDDCEGVQLSAMDNTLLQAGRNTQIKQPVLASIYCAVGPCNVAIEPEGRSLQFEPGAKSFIFHLFYDHIPSYAELYGDVAAYPLIKMPENHPVINGEPVHMRFTKETWMGSSDTYPMKHRPWNTLSGDQARELIHIYEAKQNAAAATKEMNSRKTHKNNNRSCAEPKATSDKPGSTEFIIGFRAPILPQPHAGGVFSSLLATRRENLPGQNMPA